MGPVDGLQGGIKGGVEKDKGQDWDLNLGLDWKLKGKWEQGGERAGREREGKTGRGRSKLFKTIFAIQIQQDKCKKCAEQRKIKYQFKFVGYGKFRREEL